QAAEIYKLYRAGILEGSGDIWNGAWTVHLCKPSDTIRRSEVAAILTRMTRPETRKLFSMTGYTAQYVRTDGYRDGEVYPKAILISSADELNRYYEENRNFYDFGHREKVYADSSIGFADAIGKYDAAWFENHRLILVLLEEGSGSVRHELAGVMPRKNGLTVEIVSRIPEVGTSDMAEWHILIETERMIDPETEIRVSVSQQGPGESPAGEEDLSDSARIADFAVRLLKRSAGVGEGPTGFIGSDLCIHTGGKTLLYEREAAGTGSLTRKTVLDSFSEDTEWEGHFWEVYSVEEYPDLSRVVIKSGSNSSWTYRRREVENTLVSPLSVLGALAMTANGAKGETREEMETVLGMDTGELNRYFSGLMPEEDKTEKGPRFHLANSVWFTDGGGFEADGDFLETVEKYYRAGVFEAPFDEGTLREINGWVKENTDGMIPEILDRIPPDAVMYLVNALAFDGEWTEPYKEHLVDPGTFTREDGTKTEAVFMRSRENLYLESDVAVGFVKPYKGGKYAFAALLPKEGFTVSDCIVSLDGKKLTDLLASAAVTPVEAALPKFETGSSFELSEVLALMGMPTAFDPVNADFSGLGTGAGQNLYISRVLHKTFISVAEQGTKAGAATAVEMAKNAALPLEEPKRVILDRPFVYMLIDCETNIPFFLGALTDVGE
ncbi:MAG: serpin family protein, partial [Clostridia bacterium]|nr:serpin family protein [Clostridia bacterium]